MLSPIQNLILRRSEQCLSVAINLITDLMITFDLSDEKSLEAHKAMDQFVVNVRGAVSEFRWRLVKSGVIK